MNRTMRRDTPRTGPDKAARTGRLNDDDMMRECLRNLYLRHHRFVWRLCWHYLQNSADADDLAHDVLLKAARGYASFRHDCTETTWLHRITVNQCQSHFRRRLTRRRALGGLLRQCRLRGEWPCAPCGGARSYGCEGPEAIGLAGHAGLDEPRLVAARVLEVLQASGYGHLGQIARLRFYQGLPQRGIAQRTGLPRPVVRRSVNRIIGRAGDLFRTFAEEGPPLRA